MSFKDFIDDIIWSVCFGLDASPMLDREKVRDIDFAGWDIPDVFRVWKG
jgi:hypothetical protein